MLFLVTVFIISLVRYNKKLYAHLKEKQVMQLRFNETLLQSQLEIQEETFKTISQEIHDNIGQELSFVKLNLNSIVDNLKEEQKEIVSESKEILSKSIQDLRDIAKSLNTEYLTELGLPEAIQQQLKLLEKSGSFKTELIIKGEFVKIESNKSLVLFRSVQELLNNVVKHSDGNLVSIEIQSDQHKIFISVTDNGKGFNMNDFSTIKHKGLGLSNVIDRIKLINGTLSVNSHPGNGTQTIIELNKSFEQ